MTNDPIDEFLSYVTKFEPDFRTRISGAAEGDISSLQALSGFELPPAYHSYLQHLGGNDGGLDIGQGATTRAGAVIRYYKELQAENESAPPGCIVIAVNGVAVGETSLQFAEAGEPRVVNTSGDQIKDLYAESLPDLLFRVAFIKYRAKQLKFSNIYEGSLGGAHLETGRDVALANGFDQQWFSDSICFCGERADAAIMINQFVGRVLWIRIASDDRDVVQSLGRIFESQIDVRFKQTWP